MSNFLLIGICIGAGMLLSRRADLPNNAHQGINTWIIYIALPAVAFKYIPNIEWSTELLIPALAPIGVFIAGYIFIQAYARAASLDRKSTAGLTLIASLSNTSFVGFPLVMAYYGAENIGIAVITDQLTFLLFATLGVVIAIHGSGAKKVSPGLLVNKLIKFPPFIAAIAALTLPKFFDITPIAPVFDMIAATIAPMALFSIGLQLQLSGWREEIKHISAVLIYKLCLAPALVFTVLWSLQIHGIIAQVSNFEMAMPCLVSAAVLASEYKLNPRLINLIVGICILAGFITTAGWYFILQSIG